MRLEKRIIIYITLYKLNNRFRIYLTQFVIQANAPVHIKYCDSSLKRCEVNCFCLLVSRFARTHMLQHALQLDNDMHSELSQHLNDFCLPDRRLEQG